MILLNIIFGSKELLCKSFMPTKLGKEERVKPFCSGWYFKPIILTLGAQKTETGRSS